METFDVNQKKKVGISTLIGFIYSCTDEIHQLFISERSGSIIDVFIDTLGTLFRHFCHSDNYKSV